MTQVECLPVSLNTQEQDKTPGEPNVKTERSLKL